MYSALLLLLLSSKPLLGKQSKSTEHKDKNEQPGCGWQSCNPTKPGAINVHLVPHSHDDAGWLKTVDQYYFGEKSRIQLASIHDTLDTVVEELVKDPTRKFTQVETGYMWRWWTEQDDVVRNKTLQLINSGQLQFAGGGWSMNDEATTHFVSIINNLELGVNWLQDNLGACSVPDIAWQIDPFGHSKEQARIFAEMGYKGLFFARIDFQEKEMRKASKTLQMVWEGESRDETKSIFTGVFDEHYTPPAGFCWDVLCDDEPINDDPKLPQMYNVDSRIDEFTDQVNSHVKYYKDRHHIMFLMGGDFHYQFASQNYNNMDKLINHMNNRSKETGIHLLYSTPGCYLKSLYKDNYTYPRQTKDFFPYASDEGSFWTGYFTSRPSIKIQDRIGQRDLLVCRQIEVLESTLETDVVFNMQRAMGLMQHHDAVTGTERTHVASDYTQRLYEATQGCQSQNVNIMKKKSGMSSTKIIADLPYEPKTYCPNLNSTDCPITENSETFIIFIYNPLSHKTNTYIRLPVRATNLSLYTLDGRSLSVQMNNIPNHIKKIPSRNSSAEFEAIFKVHDIPALGFTAIFATKKSKGVPVSLTEEIPDHNNSNTNLNNRNDIDIKLQYYESCGDVYSLHDKNSGAYVFNPNQHGKHDFQSNKSFTIIGPIVNETFTVYDDWGVVALREYLEEEYTEVAWQVGPIPDFIGTEVVIVYSSNLTSNGTFYTDSNGRQMIKRVRSSYAEDKFETSNYYPVTSRIELRSKNGELMTVLPDRSEGGTSLVDGEIELMLHRRLFYDDGFGVGEALNEVEQFGEVKQGLVALGKHMVLAGHTLQQARVKMFQNNFPPQLSFLPVNMDLNAWLESSFTEYSGLLKELPPNVQVLTLARRNCNTVLLRLYNMMDGKENKDPVQVDLDGLLTEFKVLKLQEQNLSAAKDLKSTDKERLKWRTAGGASNPPKKCKTMTNFVVELKPEQIRTFLLTVQRN